MSKSSVFSEPTVPVFVDNMLRLDDFQRTRCIYYRLEFTHEPPTWPAAAPADGTYEVANVGGWAVLSGPGGGKTRFEELGDIERTLDELAEDDDVAFELGYCWLPNEVVDAVAKDGGIRPGDVLRLSAPLFRHCCRHAGGVIDDALWRAGFADVQSPIALSPEETEAFRAWRLGRIGKTRDRYRSESYAERRLPKRGVSK